MSKNAANKLTIANKKYYARIFLLAAMSCLLIFFGCGNENPSAAPNAQDPIISNASVTMKTLDFVKEAAYPNSYYFSFSIANLPDATGQTSNLYYYIDYRFNGYTLTNCLYGGPCSHGSLPSLSIGETRTESLSNVIFSCSQGDLLEAEIGVYDAPWNLYNGTGTPPKSVAYKNLIYVIP